jgi:hypothetical protein
MVDLESNVQPGALRRADFKPSHDQDGHSEAASGIEPLYRVLQAPDEEGEDPS